MRIFGRQRGAALVVKMTCLSKYRINNRYSQVISMLNRKRLKKAEWLRGLKQKISQNLLKSAGRRALTTVDGFAFELKNSNFELKH